MKIAYMILAHQYPEQLIRLILRLNTEATLIFVHINKRTSDKMYHQVISHLSNFSNVYFLKRHKVYWGSFSFVNAIIQGIEEILSKNISFDHLILLSGQDYPIKSNNQLKNFLQKNKGKSFMHHFPLPRREWSNENGGFNRIDYWHFHLLDKSIRVSSKHSFNSRFASLVGPFLIFFFLLFFPEKRKFPGDFKPFGGSGFWSMSRECVEYVHNFIKQNHAFVNFFKYARFSDEIFFQTILANSPLKESIINDNLRYIAWLPLPNSGHPKILYKSDFAAITKSSKFFARKFDITKDTDVLDMIDDLLAKDLSSST